jgi:hypothetical protein
MRQGSGTIYRTKLIPHMARAQSEPRWQRLDWQRPTRLLDIDARSEREPYPHVLCLQYPNGRYLYMHVYVKYVPDLVPGLWIGIGDYWAFEGQ